MTITNGYMTLAEVKAAIADGMGTSQDTVVERVVTAVSRKIDTYCRRRFYGAYGTRYYSPVDSRVLDIHDVGTSGSITLKTDEDGDRTYETTWASTDYDLWPYNEAPYMELHVTPQGNNAWPVSVSKGVQLASIFGYQSGTSASAPSDVREACLIQAVRIYHRKDNPYGVAGNAEMGQLIQIAKLDPDVEMFLKPYRRHGGHAG
jgi:hypothetical protein